MLYLISITSIVLICCEIFILFYNSNVVPKILKSILFRHEFGKLIIVVVTELFKDFSVVSELHLKFLNNTYFKCNFTYFDIVIFYKL